MLSRGAIQPSLIKRLAHLWLGALVAALCLLAGSTTAVAHAGHSHDAGMLAAQLSTQALVHGVVDPATRPVERNGQISRPPDVEHGATIELWSLQRRVSVATDVVANVTTVRGMGDTSRLLASACVCSGACGQCSSASCCSAAFVTAELSIYVPRATAVRTGRPADLRVGSVVAPLRRPPCDVLTA